MTNKPTPTHTPTLTLFLPWNYEAVEYSDGYQYSVWDCRGDHLFDCRSEEQAAHIVRCVNSFDAMLKGLEAARIYGEAHSQRIDLVEAALKLAKGE